MSTARRTFAGLVLTVVFTSCASFDNMLASMSPELTPAELAALTREAECEVVPLRHYATVDGSLAEGDCRDAQGRYVDFYGLRTNDEPRGQQFTNTRYTIFRLSSDEIDMFLKVKPKEGWQWWEDDDGGDGVNSYLRRALGDGIYLIAVTSRQPGTGAYRLKLNRSAPPSR